MAAGHGHNGLVRGDSIARVGRVLSDPPARPAGDGDSGSAVRRYLRLDLVWLYDYRGESSVGEFLMRPAVLFFFLMVTPLVATAAMWYRRRLRELKNPLELRRTWCPALAGNTDSL